MSSIKINKTNNIETKATPWYQVFNNNALKLLISKTHCFLTDRTISLGS